MKQTQKDEVRRLLQKSYNYKTILTGQLIGKKKIGDKTYGVVLYQGIRCLLPAEEVDLSTQTVNDPIGALLGATIEFVVTDIQKDNVFISRKVAKQLRRIEFENNVKEGQIINGRVIGVSPKNVYVDAFGYEFGLTAKDVDYKWIHDMRERFKVGDSVKAKVISKNPPQISIKEALTTPWEKDPDRYKVGEQYVGKVVAVANLGIFVDLLEDGRQVLCPPMGIKTPVIGSVVVVLIKDISKEQKKMWGDIVRVISEPRI